MNDSPQMVQWLTRCSGQRKIWRFRTAVVLLIVLVLALPLISCSGPGGDRPTAGGPNQLVGIPKTLQEVSPPTTIQALSRELDIRPEVRITSPRRDETLEDDRVTVQFQVSDFPAFKDEILGMGPHLHVIVDNEPYRAVYDPSQPLILEDLAPGTHTVRVFASRPWHESFKNAEAYDQTQFHVFTQTPDGPELDSPLLTYSRPKGSYGAEPIMLDVYLSNAPLHMVAQEDVADEISDWKIRCTINGQSFTFDTWEPMYLTGFKPGKNWLQIELLDENDRPIANAYNNTARLITLTPGGEDTLSKLVRGDLSAQQARPIIISGYEPAIETPEVVEPLDETESSKAIPSEAESLDVDVPDVDVPDVDVPDEKALDTDAPNLDVPTLKNPDIDVPSAADSDTDAPEPVKLPKTEAFPPGILIEETLPEVAPAAGNANKSETPPDKSDRPKVEAASEPAPKLVPAPPSSEAPANADQDFSKSSDIETLPEIVPAD